MRRGWRSVARDELLSALHHSAAEGPRASTAISSGRPQTLFALLRRAGTGQSSNASAREPQDDKAREGKRGPQKHV